MAPPLNMPLTVFNESGRLITQRTLWFTLSYQYSEDKDDRRLTINCMQPADPDLPGILPLKWCGIVLLRLLCCCFRETTCTLAKDFTAHVFKATSEDEVGTVVLLSNEENSNINTVVIIII